MWMDGWMDMTKLIVTFCHFANTPKNKQQHISISSKFLLQYFLPRTWWCSVDVLPHDSIYVAHVMKQNVHWKKCQERKKERKKERHTHTHTHTQYIISVTSRKRPCSVFINLFKQIFKYNECCFQSSSCLTDNMLILKWFTCKTKILILSSHLCLGLSSGLLPSGFPIKALYACLLSPIHLPRPAHLSLLELITSMIFGEE